MSADPRDVGEVQDGTRLRDAAVNPAAGDFLPPTNAGLPGEAGNPHGLNVISPEIHATEGVHTIRPGVVSSDPAVQSTEQTAHLVEQQPTAAAPAI
jgi:hypothetical protein